MNFLFHIKAFSIFLLPTFILSFLIQPPEIQYKHWYFNHPEILNFILRSLAYTAILYFILYTIQTQLKSDVIESFNFNYGGLNFVIS